MTALDMSIPDSGGDYEVTNLGGQATPMPLSGLQRLQEVARQVPAEVLDQAEIATTLAAHREWVAQGRPGAVSHEQAMAELLAEH
jgi:hypothetical protein